MTLSVLNQRERNYFDSTSSTFKKGKVFSSMKIVLKCFVIVLLAVQISGCTLLSINTQQEKATELLPELVSESTYGQVFLSSRNNLSRIDLGTATYGRNNSARVIFHLREGLNSSVDVFTTTLQGGQIENDRPTTIVFPVIKASAGKEYYFFLESPNATKGNAISVYANATNTLINGNMVINGELQDKDLVFTAYSSETYTFIDLFTIFLFRAKQDPFFFAFYTVLILVVFGFLIKSFFEKIEQK
jgi:hypothetical protein